MSAQPLSAPPIPLGQGCVVGWPDQTDVWPGEPAETLAPQIEICLGCGREQPAGDVYEIAPDVWRCLDCWVVSR